MLSIPVAIVLLLALRRSYVVRAAAARALHAPSRRRRAGRSVALVVLAVATVATALVAEILVGSIEVFADEARLCDFFVAAVIVAIVGNAAEHGGAVVVARRGRVKLGRARSRSPRAPQVAVFLSRRRAALVGDQAALALVPAGRDRVMGGAALLGRRSCRPAEGRAAGSAPC